MHFFTSVTTNYIPKARILVKSIKKFNPDAVFILALSDSLPNSFEIENEPFDDIVFTDTLSSIKNVKNFFFRHNITEICTAVKPAMALEILNKYNADSVCYLDPDIAVFSRLIELEEALKSYSMVFTPHSTTPEKEEELIVGNEILFLKKGTNNLGFFAVKNDDEGLRFLKWWNERLMTFCIDDNYMLHEKLHFTELYGLYTDQKWIDLVPSFFDNYLFLKHPGYNVSTWNLSNRIVTKKDNKYYVNDKPLRFFHFSGVDSQAHASVLEFMNNLYPHTKSVNELSKWYEKEQTTCENDPVYNHVWKYANYDNGNKIEDFHRKILVLRRDLYTYFDNPFDCTKPGCYFDWMHWEYPELFTGGDLKNPVSNNKKRSLIKRIVLVFIRPNGKLYKKMRAAYIGWKRS